MKPFHVVAKGLNCHHYTEHAIRQTKIIQIGYWLRKLHSIYRIKTPQYKKVFQRVNHIQQLDKLLKKERQLLMSTGTFDDAMYQPASTLRRKLRELNFQLFLNAALHQLQYPVSNNKANRRTFPDLFSVPFGYWIIYYYGSRSSLKKSRATSILLIVPQSRKEGEYNGLHYR